MAMVGPTLTAGQIVAYLSTLPAGTPVIMVITDTDRACNVTGLEVEYDDADGSVDIAVLACADNYDPRQW